MSVTTISPQLAADRAQVSRGTIMNAIKNGSLEAHRDNHNRWQIHPDNLLKWLSNRDDNITVSNDKSDTSEQDFLFSIRKLEGVVELREMRISELESDRDAWKEQAQRLAEPRSIWERLFGKK